MGFEGVKSLAEELNSMVNPLMSLSLLVTGLLEISLPLYLGLLAARRLRVDWRPFVIGATLFTLSLVRMPLNTLVQRITYRIHLGFYTSSLFFSITSALFEEGVRLLAFMKLLEERSWRIGIMYGLGHGGMESILLAGVNSFMLGLLLLIAPSTIPFASLILETLSPALPLLALYERMMAITIQLALTLLVLKSVSEAKPLYLVAAILIHFFINLSALLLLRKGTIWVEAMATPIAVLSLLYVFKTRPKEE